MRISAKHINAEIRRLTLSAYLRRWTRELGLDTLLEECLE
jgi:hypothetical protein